MRKSSQVEIARLDRSLVSMIGQRPSPSHPIEPAHAAQARRDTMADWLRLRRIVDALLRRAATSKAAAAIAATRNRAGAATRTMTQPQEAHHG